MVDRTHRELTDDDIARIAGTYHAWRGERDAGEYADVPGFCASATTEQIAKHQHVLTPGRYVGAEDVEEDSEPLDEKIARLTKELYEAFEESDRLQARARSQLARFASGS
jgi:type I restriction enzyme M protein